MGKLDRDEAVLQHAALCKRVAKVVGRNTFLIVEIRHEEVEPYVIFIMVYVGDC